MDINPRDYHLPRNKCLSIGMIKPKTRFIWLENNIQLMTFDEVNTSIDQPVESEVNIMFHGLINPCIHRYWKTLTVLFYDINQIWINTNQRRLCSPDTPDCVTSAIINLIVYRTTPVRHAVEYKACLGTINWPIFITKQFLWMSKL